MLAKRIIPCLDVDNGRVKKGVNFVNLVDVGSPVDIAATYEEQGADARCGYRYFKTCVHAPHRRWWY